MFFIRFIKLSKLIAFEDAKSYVTFIIRFSYKTVSKSIASVELITISKIYNDYDIILIIISLSDVNAHLC